jgi:hypothetical protein
VRSMPSSPSSAAITAPAGRVTPDIRNSDPCRVAQRPL